MGQDGFMLFPASKTAPLHFKFLATRLIIVKHFMQEHNNAARVGVKLTSCNQNRLKNDFFYLAPTLPTVEYTVFTIVCNMDLLFFAVTGYRSMWYAVGRGVFRGGPLGHGPPFYVARIV